MQARHRTLLIPLLLTALLLRSIVAAGYMPDEDGVIRLCTPEGMVSVIIDPETGDPVEVDASAMPECPWASVVSPESWLPGSSWPPLHHSIAVSPLAADRCQVRPSIFLSPPSRAPPRRPC